MAIDRVHPLKLEDPNSGGTQTDQFPTSLNKNEDYVDVRGISFQSSSSDDEAYYFERDYSDNINLYTSSSVRFRVSSGGNFVFTGNTFTFNGSSFDINASGSLTLSGSSIGFFGQYTFPTAVGSTGDVLTLSGTVLKFDSAGGGAFEAASNVVRGVSGTVAYATDDFVFGSYQLNDTGNSDYDNRFLFDKSAGTFFCGGQTGTQWDSRTNYSFVWGYNCYLTGVQTDYAKAGGNASYAQAEGAVAEGYTTYAAGDYSRAENYNTDAYGDYAHAEGYASRAGYGLGEANSAAHAEGYDTDATGLYGSHSEGRNTGASGDSSHSEGRSTTSVGDYSHAEGYLSESNGQSSHAEGQGTIAGGNSAHAEGFGNSSYSAASTASHTEGYYCRASNGTGNHAEGANSEASGSSACHAEGNQTIASGQYSHSEGTYTTASGDGSHAEGYGSSGNRNIASSYGAHVEGYECDATTGYGNHAEGYHTQATGAFGAHSEGNATTASGQASHSEGQNTTATASQAHSEGLYCDATAQGAHAEGKGASGAHNQAVGEGSHAEGYQTVAGTASTDYGAHSEGMYTTAHQAGSHAEGAYSEAYKDYSHAEGYYSYARYQGSHASAVGRRGTESGSLQREIIQCTRETSNTTSDTALWPNNSAGNDLILPSNYCYDAYILITGVVVSSTGSAAVGDSVHYTIRSAVTNVAGTTTLTYSNITIEHADAALVTCDANVEASVSDSLRIIVNGLSDAVIQWNATVVLTETYFA